MPTPKTRGEGPDERPNRPVPFKKLERMVADLNVANEQTQAIGTAFITLADTPSGQTILRRFLKR